MFGKAQFSVRVRGSIRTAAPDGSTLLARTAGNQTATRTTPIKIAGTTQNQGSHAFTLYRKPAIYRVNSKAAGEADHGLGQGGGAVGQGLCSRTSALE